MPEISNTGSFSPFMRGKALCILLVYLLPVLWVQARENIQDYPGQNLWDEEGPAVLYHGRRDCKKLALTINDGWVPDYELLDFLEEMDIACTVFIPGKLVNFRPRWIRRMKAMGFEICNHGYSHKLLPFLDEETQEEEILSTRKAIESLVGESSSSLRFGRIMP